jgi:uncharacterized protein YxeA
MKKIMIGALGLSLLSGTAVFAAQNTATSSDSTMKSTHAKKHKKSKGSTSTGSTTTTTSSK